MFRRQRTHEVDPAQALELQRSGAILLDIRQNDEWAAVHAPGAVHVPLARTSGATNRFRGHEVLTVRRSGSRPGRAAKILAAAGMDVCNVAGGMSSWSAAGLPVVRGDGSPGRVD